MFVARRVACGEREERLSRYDGQRESFAQSGNYGYKLGFDSFGFRTAVPVQGDESYPGAVRSPRMWERPEDADHTKGIRITKEIREAFKRFDTDNSGDIDQDELLLALGQLGMTGVDKERTKEIAGRFDDNGDGTMQIEEFAQLVTELEAFKRGEARAADGSVRSSYDDDEEWGVFDDIKCSCAPWRWRRSISPQPSPASSPTPARSNRVEGSQRSEAAADDTTSYRSRFMLSRSKTAPMPVTDSQRSLSDGSRRSTGSSSRFMSRMSDGAGEIRKSMSNFRMSTAGDKSANAADAARRRGASQQEDQELRDLALEAFDVVLGQDSSPRSLTKENFAAALTHVAGDLSRDDLVEHIAPFLDMEMVRGLEAEAARRAARAPHCLPARPPARVAPANPLVGPLPLQAKGEQTAFSVDEFGAYYKRFEGWATSRKALQMASIDLTASEIQLVAKANTDTLLIAACQHCPRVRKIIVTNAKLHNSTLTDVAARFRGELLELELTGSRGFDDLGIKAFAANCPALVSLKVAQTPLTDNGLTPVLKNCPQIRTLEVSEIPKVSACLKHVHAECAVKRVPVVKATSAVGPSLSMPSPSRGADSDAAQPFSGGRAGRKFSLQDGLLSLGGAGISGVSSVAGRVRRASRELQDKVEVNPAMLARRGSRDRAASSLPAYAPPPDGRHVRVR